MNSRSKQQPLRQKNISKSTKTLNISLWIESLEKPKQKNNFTTIFRSAKKKLLTAKLSKKQEFPQENHKKLREGQLRGKTWLR